MAAWCRASCSRAASPKALTATSRPTAVGGRISARLENAPATARIRPRRYGFAQPTTLTVFDAPAMLRPVRTDDQTIGAERRKAPRPRRHDPLLDRALRHAILRRRRGQPGDSTWWGRLDWR